MEWILRCAQDDGVKDRPHRYDGLSCLVALCSASTKALSLSGLFTPGACSTPLFTSMNFAPVAETAAAMLVALRPPERIHVLVPCVAWWRLNLAQSPVSPVPPNLSA